MPNPIAMPTSWLAELDEAARQREEEIVRLVLQQPDYPPLPACPECNVHPTEIKQWVGDPDFDIDRTFVWVAFKPCKHIFRARGF